LPRLYGSGSSSPRNSSPDPQAHAETRPEGNSPRTGRCRRCSTCSGGLALCAALLAWGGALLYPFETDTVVWLSGDRLVATYYGAYNTASGIAISLGNLAVGALFDTGVRWLPWAVLAATGLLCAGPVAALHRAGYLTPEPERVPVSG
jgi:hypothetical protein